MSEWGSIIFGVSNGLGLVFLLVKFSICQRDITKQWISQNLWYTRWNLLLQCFSIGTWRPRVNFINVLRAILHAQIPKVQKKRLTAWLSFLHFRDLRMIKLLIKCWWNWHQLTETVFESTKCTKIILNRQ